MYDRILVSTDGSTETERAVGHGLGLGLGRTYDVAGHGLYVTDKRVIRTAGRPQRCGRVAVLRRVWAAPPRRGAHTRVCAYSSWW